MIIKGGSRAAPDQLARHLQRQDTNERVEILELQSPASGLRDAFRDWQTLSEGTRGFKGLYHANIDPAADYAMTPDQWQRAVGLLEKELGFEGQPRAVVMHEKHDRQHIHVVWARTDIDTMTLCPDGNNYLAHERASQALELEFGHEQVPGKHAKRDREKQPEFPKAEYNQAEWQQGERQGRDPAARKDQITAIRQAADSGQAFKAALEEQGYMLAKGDRRDFVIVDQTGAIHSLGRQIRDLKAAALREFMKDIDRESLPTAAQAATLQKQRQKEAKQAQKSEEPVNKPPDGEPDPSQAQTEDLRKASAERQAREAAEMRERHEAELRHTRDILDREIGEKLADRDAMQEAARARFQRENAPPRTGFDRLIGAVQRWWNPKLAREQEAGRQRRQQEMENRQTKERADYAALLKQARDLDLENLIERHAQQLRDHAYRTQEDLDRHIRERETARRLLAEIEERERQRAQERTRDGPERPPPTRSL
jgi:hypothetical protein